MKFDRKSLGAAAVAVAVLAAPASGAWAQAALAPTTPAEI